MLDAPRLSDWETRFANWQAEAAERVTKGDANYCALMAAGAVEAVTGKNPSRQFRGRFAEVKADLKGTIDSLFPERPTPLARRGDLVWNDGSVGVVIGSEAIFVSAERSLMRVPRAQWEKAWTVGGDG